LKKLNNKRKLLVFFTIILTFSLIVVGEWYRYKKEHNFPKQSFYYDVTYKKLYPVSKALVKLNFYKPDFADLCIMYRGSVDFEYLKWTAENSKMDVLFVPIKKGSTKEEIGWFLDKGADINSYIPFVRPPIFDVGIICALYSRDAFVERLILYEVINFEQYNLIPFLLERGADPTMKTVVPERFLQSDYYLSVEESYKSYYHYGKYYNKTPRECLEIKEKALNQPGKFNEYRDILKEYEQRFSK